MSAHNGEQAQAIEPNFETSDIIRLKNKLYSVVSMPPGLDKVTVMPVAATNYEGVFSVIGSKREYSYEDLSGATVHHYYSYSYR